MATNFDELWRQLDACHIPLLDNDGANQSDLWGDERYIGNIDEPLYADVIVDAMNALPALRAMIEAAKATDLDTLLRRLAGLTDAAQARWEAAERQRAEAEEEEPDIDYSIWFALECDADGAWECGYCYRPDEASEWALHTTGRTPTEAATALLALLEEP